MVRAAAVSLGLALQGAVMNSEDEKNPGARPMQILAKRAVAVIVLVTFCTWTMASASAQLPRWLRVSQKAASPVHAPTAADQLSNAIAALADQVSAAIRLLDSGMPSSREIAQVVRLATVIKSMQAAVESEIAGAAPGRFSEALVERRNSALNTFRDRHSRAISHLQTIERSAPDSQAQKQALRALMADLAAWRGGSRYLPNQPHQLPFGPAKPRSLKWEPADKSTTGVTKAISPPGDADLAETVDAQITPEVRALAQDLGGNPHLIYQWVVQNVRFIPTFGSIQGSAYTLLARQGNAFDISSLLIALLRASNVHARYVLGQVETEGEVAKAWLGVSNASAASSLLSQGGVSNTTVQAAGTVSAIRFNHVWVEAYVDYVPSRGARHRKGSFWVPLDASFKNTTRASVVASLNPDAAGLISAFTASAQQDIAAGWVKSNGAPRLGTWLEDAARVSLNRALETNPSISENALLTAFTQSAANIPFLLETLPYSVRMITSRESVLPAAFRGTAHVGFFASPQDFSLGSPSFEKVLDLPAIAGKKVALHFVGATDQDKQIISDAVISGSGRLPAYMVNSVGELSVDDSLIGRTPAVRLGTDNFWAITLSIPGLDGTPASFPSVAGDEIVFGFNLGGQNGATYQAAQVKYASTTPSNTLELVARSYWTICDQQDEIIAATFETISHRLPSVGIFSQPLVATYSFGVPVSASYYGRSIDVRLSTRTEAGLSGQRRAAFFLTSGVMASFMEGAVFDALFDRQVGSGRSAVRLLSDALNSGQRLFKITPVNYSSVAPQLDARDVVLQEISNAIGAGKEVYVHEHRIQEGGWTGTGFLIIDPLTGAGAYSLDATGNGGEEGASCPLTPVAQPGGLPANSLVIGLLLIVALVFVAAAGKQVVAVLAGAAIIALLVQARANAGEMIPLKPLSAGAAEEWNVISGGRQFPTSAPKKTLQSCADDVKSRLYSEQQSACDGIKKCSESMGCTELQNQIGKRAECIAARLEIMTQCWSGGDAGHWEQVQGQLNGMSTCRNCLAPKLAGGQCIN